MYRIFNYETMLVEVDNDNVPYEFDCIDNAFNHITNVLNDDTLTYDPILV